VTTQEISSGGCQGEQSREDRGLGFTHFFVWLPIGLAIYVLSTGPIIKVARLTSSPMLDNFLRAAYAPLGAVSDHSRIVEKFFEWYVKNVWHA
jgi:hypothetical protein